MPVRGRLHKNCKTQIWSIFWFLGIFRLAILYLGVYFGLEQFQLYIGGLVIDNAFNLNNFHL